MKEMIVDLRLVRQDDDGEYNIADHPEHIELERIMFDYAGKVIRIKITEIKKQI